MKRQDRAISIETVASQIDGLTRHIDALEKQVRLFGANFKQANKVPFHDEMDRSRDRPKRADSTDSIQMLMDSVRDVDNRVRAIEIDFGAVRSKIEDLEREGKLAAVVGRLIKPVGRK